VLAALVVAATLGEASYTLSEQRVAVPAATASPASPAWSHAIDPPGDGNMLAIGDGIVAFADNGRLCAYDDKTGAGVWCAGAGSSPVYAPGVVVYATTGNAVRAVDARTGSTRWQMSDAHRIWRTGDGLVLASVSVEDPQTRVFHATLQGVSFNGAARWSKTLPADGAEATATSQYLIWRWCEGGATLTCQSAVAAYDGGIVGEVAADVLGVNGSLIVDDSSFNDLEEVQDHFLMFDIGAFDSRRGTYAAQFTYAPDYQQNLARWNANACQGSKDAVTRRLDGDDLYVTSCRNLYRYRLAPAAGQRPLLLANDVTFWGGPYRQRLYVERDDGIWSLQPGADSVRAQLVVPSSQFVADFTIATGMGFGVFRDGSVHGFDLDSGRATFEATPCHGEGFIPVRVAATEKRIFIACASARFWTLYAYAR
jgi:hypothetical protein